MHFVWLARQLGVHASACNCAYVRTYVSVWSELQARSIRYQFKEFGRSSPPGMKPTSTRNLLSQRAIPKHDINYCTIDKLARTVCVLWEMGLRWTAMTTWSSPEAWLHSRQAYSTLIAWPLDYRFCYPPCLTALPVQYPVLNLYRSAMGKFIIILVSYFCQLLEYFKTYNLKA